jgi:hypothetical protein
MDRKIMSELLYQARVSANESAESKRVMVFLKRRPENKPNKLFLDTFGNGPITFKKIN